MKGVVPLSVCLEKFVQPDRLYDSGFTCKKCKKQVDIEKKLSIYRFPKVLVIHLKRWAVKNNKNVRVDDMVSFPTMLDMTRFGPLSEHESKAKADQYQLYATINHYGSINKGHYYSEVKNLRAKKESKNLWYYCDDKDIESLQAPETETNMAYILFYAMP